MYTIKGKYTKEAKRKVNYKIKDKEINNSKEIEINTR